MEKETRVKSLFQYFKLFNQRTSIRGVAKIETTNVVVIKWFWAFFILCACVIMIVLVVLSVGKYLQFDTTMKVSYSTTGSEDFPEVTVCSKRFFNLLSTEDISPFHYLDEYNTKILSQVSQLVSENNYNKVFRLMVTQLTTSSFFYNYYTFIKQRTELLSKELRNSCNITALDGKKRGNKVNCKIKPVYNPQYLNCLAFSIPQVFSMNKSTRFQMDINFNYLETPMESISEIFRVDEYVSDHVDTDTFEITRLFIHPVSDYPFLFDFEVPFDSKMANHYLIEKMLTQFNYIDGITEKCRINTVNMNSYGSSFTPTRETLCESLATQYQVYKHCSCYIDYHPNNESAYSTSNLCIIDEIDENCANNAIYDIQDSLSSICLPFCTKTIYTTSHKVKPFQVSNFSADVEALTDTVIECDESYSKCVTDARCLMKDLYKYFPLFFCNKIGSEQTNTVAETVSNTANIVSDNLYQSTDNFSVRVEMRSVMQVKKESLLMEINTLLSQLGGLCAFFTGLTFTIIAEILESTIFWIIDKIKGKIKEDHNS